MQKIKIIPFDTVFFRDAKPFTFGENGNAESLFPPNPGTFYGLIRSIYFYQHPDHYNFDILNSKEDPTTGLNIIDIRLINDFDEELFAAPKDIVFESVGGEMHACLLESMELTFNSDNESTNFISNIQQPSILKSNIKAKIKSGSGSLIRKSGMESYRINNLANISYDSFDNYLTVEPKVGIGLDSTTGSTDEGKLYQQNTKRMMAKDERGNISSIHFEVSFSGLNLNNGNGNVRFGSDGKLVQFIVSDDSSVTVETTLTEKQDYKMYFKTPAIFNEGSFPSQLFQIYDISLKTMATSRPVKIGGFDMKTKKPKPLYFALVAGTVFYIRFNDPTKQKDFMDKYSSTFKLSDHELDKQGYGKFILI